MMGMLHDVLAALNLLFENDAFVHQVHADKMFRTHWISTLGIDTQQHQVGIHRAFIGRIVGPVLIVKIQVDIISQLKNLFKFQVLEVLDRSLLGLVLLLDDHLKVGLFPEDGVELVPTLLFVLILVKHELDLADHAHWCTPTRNGRHECNP